MQKPKLVLIGSSTGGPGHLDKIINALVPDFKHTIIIAQHMDAIFIPSMVKQFSEKTNINIYLAKENLSIKPASIVFTHKNLTRLLYNTQNGLILKNSIINRPYLPSVNCLFETASLLCNEFNILACLLTGIGDDGANGLKMLNENGAKCLAESEETCIVFGMPKSAYELNSDLKLLTLDKIIQEIINF